MNLSDTVVIPSEVMARQVGDETVILDLASGNYFGLDPVGTRMWQLLTQGKTLADICEMLLDEYEVSRADLEHDLIGLVQQLRARQLVRMA